MVGAKGDNSAKWRDVGDAIQHYFADRLNVLPGAMTFADIEKSCFKIGVKPEEVEKIRKIYLLYERVNFAKNPFVESSVEERVELIKEVITEIEEELKK
jgi:hypothetical protein